MLALDPILILNVTAMLVFLVMALRIHTLGEKVETLRTQLETTKVKLKHVKAEEKSLWKTQPLAHEKTL